MRGRLWLLLLGLVAILALGVAGCGDDEGEDGGTGGSKGTPETGVEVPKGNKGGTVTFLAHGDVDYVDPGQSYYTFGYMVQYATQKTLYSFTPEDSETPVPDLAEGDPQISEDQRTITVKLKKGVKFSPPVDREVTSKDVKYAFERAFSANVPSGYATSYFKDIVGAPAEPTKGVKPIAGIETPDDQTLVFKLKAPTGTVTSAALVMPITAPVPKEYAEKFDAKSPTDYNQYVAFTGPYMVKNNAEGKLTGHDPGKRLELVRNPNWDASLDYRPAYLDSIIIQEGENLDVASKRTLTGTKLLCCDSGQPPIPVLRQALRRNKDQLGRVSGGGTRWIAPNGTVPPFDNVNVRKALIAVADREALRLTRGGAEVGPIAQHWIPPGIPGHDESGGTEGFQGPEFDFMANPKGDAEVAKKYMLAAKEDGVEDIDDNGMWTGDERFLTIATNADPGQKTAEVAQAQIEKLGFKLNLRKVPQDTLYTKFCGVPKQKVAICPNVGWFKDFADPQSMLEPTFSGDAIKEQGNVNWTQLDDPEINQLMKDYSVTAAGDERNTKWADVNKKIVLQAPGIPYAWDDSFQLTSPDVQGVMNGYYTTWDLSYTFVK